MLELVELNPGPTTSARSTSRDALSPGVLNVRSARRKAVLIHVINDHRLDALALTETWIPSDAPDAVKLDVCPPSYQVLHRHRGTSDQRGGGAALVYRDTSKATTVDVGNTRSLSHWLSSSPVAAPRLGWCASTGRQEPSRRPSVASCLTFLIKSWYRATDCRRRLQRGRGRCRSAQPSRRRRAHPVWSASARH